MKINYGHGVTAGFILFAGYILYFVFLSFSEDIDLVAEDYYAQEVAFQDRIEQTKNANEFEGNIDVKKTETGVLISFPTEAVQDFSEGKAYFFRPSDVDMDITFPLTLNDSGDLTIPYQVLKDGRYELQLLWSGADKKYFIKKDIFI